MTPEDARALYSDYLEGTLDHARKDEMQAFLSQSPDSAADLTAFERTLTLLRRLPPRAPSLDMWQGLLPHIAQFKAARRLGFWERLRGRWGMARSRVSAGAILWTYALAERTHARLQRFLTHDPLS